MPSPQPASVSGVAGAMPALCFQNSLINYAGERNPLQDTIKVLSKSLRCHPERSLAPRLRGKSKSSDPYLFTRLIGVSWLSRCHH